MTKELKKKHSSRLAGGAEMDSQGGQDMWQGSGWKTEQVRWQLLDGQSHIGVGIN